MSDWSVQLPPDSTGKKSTFIAVVGLNYTGHSPQVMEVGDTVTGATSGVYGEISRVVPNSGDVTTGLIDVKVNVDSPSLVFTDTENLQIGGGTVAQADGVGEAFYTQKVVLAGGSNPFNQARVDAAGALYTRSAEGSPQFASFGTSRTSSPTILASYVFSYGEFGQWQQETVGGGALNYVANENALALDVGSASGDEGRVTSNMHHRYQPGFGQLLQMTVMCGDSGKTGCIRRWGYFNDNDGLFFELDDSQNLNVVIRTSTSGSVVETKVEQSNWNRDRLDGSGGSNNLSRFNIDLTKISIYWIDFGWLGSGRARFGVFDNNGGRVTCHVFENPNALTTPFIKTPQLPLRAEIINTALTASPSRLKMVCATVMTDGLLIPDRKRVSTKQSAAFPNVSGITTEVPLVSFRAAATFNGYTNRKITIPEFISIYVQDQPVIMRVRKGSTITTPSWTQPSASSLEYDTSGAMSVAGHELFSMMYAPGAHNTNAPQNFGIQGENLKTFADGTAGEIYTITAESLPGTAAQAQVATTWIDID